MDRKSIDKMKLDRRLIDREGWISRDELARQLDELPDVAHKIKSESSPEGGGEATAEEPSTIN